MNGVVEVTAGVWAIPLLVVLDLVDDSFVVPQNEADDGRRVGEVGLQHVAQHDDVFGNDEMGDVSNWEAMIGKSLDRALPMSYRSHFVGGDGEKRLRESKDVGRE